MKINYRYAAVALLLMLTACASLDIPTATKFGERLAGGYTTVTTVRQTNITLANADVISSKDSQNIKEQNDMARAGLDIARDMRATNPGEAQDKLDATLLILQALKAYVNTRKPSTVRSQP